MIYERVISERSNLEYKFHSTIDTRYPVYAATSSYPFLLSSIVLTYSVSLPLKYKNYLVLDDVSAIVMTCPE